MSASSIKTVLMMIFVLTFILWMFGEIAMFNCNTVNMIERPSDPIAYFTNLIGSLFSPCGGIPLWLVIIFIIPMAIVLLLWIISFIPFVG